MSKNKTDSLSGNTALPGYRIHMALQSKGRIGKSTELLFRAAWLNSRDIEWAGADLDNEHQTFFGKYPFNVELFSIENEKEAINGFSRMVKCFPVNFVNLVDIPAQATSLLFHGMEKTDFFNIVSETGGKVTVFLYAGDDFDTMTSIQRVLEFCGDKVDYVTVLSPSISPIDLFLKSPLLMKMKDLKTSFVRIPFLSDSCRMELQQAAYRLSKTLNFFDIAKNETLPISPFTRFEFQRALKFTGDQYEKVQAILLPDGLRKESLVVSTEEVLMDPRQKIRKPVDPSLLYAI